MPARDASHMQSLVRQQVSAPRHTGLEIKIHATLIGGKTRLGVARSISGGEE
jgi:hypothetical protein